MYQEITRKKKILENRKPYPVEVSNYLQELDSLDFIYSILFLDGSNAKRDDVQAIIRGDIRENVSVSDHTTIAKYRQGIEEIRFMVDIHTDLTEKSLFQIYEAMYKPFVQGYRKSNPVIEEIDYRPPHFFEIEEQMQVLFYWLYSNGEGENPIVRAAQLHNRIIEIYPFENDSLAMARIVAQYYLLRHGFPFIPWDVGIKQYHSAIMKYLDNEEYQPIYQILESGIYNKMELLLQLTLE
ncbi:MAG: Fic family protein [Anaerovoracaceae bacterium]|jgi:Fic family protein